jgi:Tfp pilus assembly PilM family ATPase
MAKAQGIDTGSWRTRAATMEGSFRRLELARVAEDVTRLEDGVIRLDLSFATADVPPGAEIDRVAAYPLDLGTVKLVKLPFSDKAAIAKALPAAVEASVPWDLDEMVLASHVLEIGPSGARIAAFVAPRDEVSARIEAFKDAGAEPRGMVFDADALAAYNDGGVQVIIDVGHRRSVLALAYGGKLQGARLVPSGGLDLTRAIAVASGVSLEEAEGMKHALTPAGASPAVAEWDDLDLDEVTATDAGAGASFRDALARAVGEWITEVRAELISLEDESGLGIDEVLLCGAGSRAQGLATGLSEALGVPVRSVTLPDGHGPEFALAIALARVAGRERPATDLRIGALSFRGHADVLWRVTAASVLGGLGCAVAALAMFVSQRVAAGNELDAVDQSIVDAVVEAVPGTSPERVAGQPRMALAVLQEATTSTQARVDALGATLGGVPPTLDMLKVLSESMPPPDTRIDVRELNLDEESLSFKAETDTYESAARIEETLKRNERFAQAKKSEEKKSGEVVTFAMNIPLDTEEPAPAEAGAEVKDGKEEGG